MVKVAELIIYDDGDASSGNSIAYSNSMGGVTFAVTRGFTRGMESATNEPSNVLCC